MFDIFKKIVREVIIRVYFFLLRALCMFNLK